MTTAIPPHLAPYMRTVPARIFRAALPDADPLQPSEAERRATAAGTGGVYCAVEPDTCRAEVPHLPNFKLYEVAVAGSIPVLDLVAYCQGEGVDPQQCYAGTPSLSKTIHSFFGQGVPAMSWKSQKQPDGTCVVLLVDHIPNLREVISYQPATN